MVPDGTGFAYQRRDSAVGGADVYVMDAASKNPGTRIMEGDCSGSAPCLPTLSCWQAIPVDAKPDAMSRLSSVTAFTGDNVVNATGASETVSNAVKRGKSQTFVIRIQNDGAVNDTVKGGPRAPPSRPRSCPGRRVQRTSRLRYWAGRIG